MYLEKYPTCPKDGNENDLVMSEEKNIPYKIYNTGFGEEKRAGFPRVCENISVNRISCDRVMPDSTGNQDISYVWRLLNT